MSDAPSPVDRPRLPALDLLRGLCVVAMMMVDWPGSWELPRLALFEHAHWLGITPPDFIFPSFLFVMGVAIPLALGPRQAAGVATALLHRRILRRAALLFAIGYVVGICCQMPAPLDFARLRVPGTLQRYAVVYPVAALLYLHLPARWLGRVTALILLAYWALLTLVPVPGFGPPDLAQYPAGEVTPNLAAWIDRTVLGHRVFEYPFDPEGILSTFPAVASALIGVMAGQWLRRERPPAERASGLLVAGVGLVVAGYLWSLAFPWSKKLWTSSFVVFMGGCDLLFLGALLATITGGRVRSRALALPRWYGVNPLAGIVVFTVVDCVMTWIPVGQKADHSTLAFKDWLFDHLFRSWLPDRHASWVYSAAGILLLGLLFRALARRRWLLSL
jgi:predicted acyltransferase